MSTPRFATFTVSALSLLLLAACGGSSPAGNAAEQALLDAAGEDAEVEVRDDGSIQITTEEGTFGTVNEVPAGWPADVKVYEGAAVTYSAVADPTTGNAAFALVFTVSDDVETVAGFYNDQLAADGWAIASTFRMQGSVVFTAEKDTRTVSVSIADVDGTTTVTLGVQEQ